MGNVNDTLFIVLTCDKYIDTRVKTIKETWGDKANVIFLSDTPQEEDIIGYNTPQHYGGIQDKYIQFFKNYKFDSYKYYFFIDDDTFINLKFYDAIELPEKDFCYCRYGLLGANGEDLQGRYTGYDFTMISGIETYRPLFYPGGGAGFIIDQSGMNKIKDKISNLNDNDIPRSGHSDVTMGFWLRLVVVKLFNSNFLNYSKPEDFSHTEEDIKKNISYHYIDPNKMRELNNLCNI